MLAHDGRVVVVLAVLGVLVNMSDIYIYPYYMCICQVIEIN